MSRNSFTSSPVDGLMLAYAMSVYSLIAELKYVDESEINGVGLADILTVDGSVVPKGNPPFVGEIDLGAPAEIVLVIAWNVGVVEQSRAGVLGLVGVGDERLERRIQPVAHRRLSKI